jgi:chaperone modulatory protein CbpM
MISIQESIDRVRIDQRLLESWIVEGRLIPHSEGEPVFSDLDVARARFFRELKEDFKENDEGIGLILYLLDQLHGMRRQMHGLMEGTRGRMRDGVAR